MRDLCCLMGDLSLWLMDSLVVMLRLRCSKACGIFRTRDPICVPCIGKGILIHWTTGEISVILTLNLNSQYVFKCEKCYQKKIG